MGASYQPVSARVPEWPDDKNHGANALRLERLAPERIALPSGRTVRVEYAGAGKPP